MGLHRIHYLGKLTKKPQVQGSCRQACKRPTILPTMFWSMTLLTPYIEVLLERMSK